MMNIAKDSLYRHIPTGNLYRVLFESVHVDTKESVVVYQSLKDQRIWVRGIARFIERFEKVECDE